MEVCPLGMSHLRGLGGAPHPQKVETETVLPTSVLLSPHGYQIFPLCWSSLGRLSSSLTRELKVEAGALSYLVKPT